MIELFLLYLLGTTHAGFAGFREATGRCLRIRKSGFLFRGVLRGLALGQVASALIVFTLILLGALGEDQRSLLDSLRPACRVALMIYGAYTAIVLLTYLPYYHRSLEVRALAIVACFSMLTLFLPLVMLLGAGVAIVLHPRPEVIILFAVSIALVSLVEPALAWFGWSSKDAARENGDLDELLS